MASDKHVKELYDVCFCAFYFCLENDDDTRTIINRYFKKRMPYCPTPVLSQ